MTIFSKKNLPGFTFVEVMMVMAIISIMAGMVTVSLSKSRVERELETNAREFAGVVREAQNYALTGKQFKIDTYPCRFQVEWSISSYKLIYYYKDASENCVSNFTIATYPLKNGVVFGNGGSLFFTVPHAVFGGNTSAAFSKSSNNYFVCISSDGRITDKNTSCP
jgi:prepilin-type N-terminal cleavage/methylation domain-containing protein